MSAHSLGRLLMLLFVPDVPFILPALQAKLPCGKVLVHTAKTDTSILLVFEDGQQGVEEARVLLCLRGCVSQKCRHSLSKTQRTAFSSTSACRRWSASVASVASMRLLKPAASMVMQAAALRCADQRCVGRIGWLEVAI
jgi:hypothetical protein